MLPCMSCKTWIPSPAVERERRPQHWLSSLSSPVCACLACAGTSSRPVLEHRRTSHIFPQNVPSRPAFPAFPACARAHLSVLDWTEQGSKSYGRRGPSPLPCSNSSTKRSIGPPPASTQSAANVLTNESERNHYYPSERQRLRPRRTNAPCWHFVRLSLRIRWTRAGPNTSFRPCAAKAHNRTDSAHV